MNKIEKKEIDFAEKVKELEIQHLKINNKLKNLLPDKANIDSIPKLFVNCKYEIEKLINKNLIIPNSNIITL